MAKRNLKLFKDNICCVRNIRRQHRNCSLFALSLSQTVNTEEERNHCHRISLSHTLCLGLALTSIESQYVFIFSETLGPPHNLLQSTWRPGPKRGLFFWQTAKVEFVRNLLRLLAEFPPPNHQSNVRYEKLDRRLTFSLSVSSLYKRAPHYINQRNTRGKSLSALVFIDSWNVIIVAPN